MVDKGAKQLQSKLVAPAVKSVVTTCKDWIKQTSNSSDTATDKSTDKPTTDKDTPPDISTDATDLSDAGAGAGAQNGVARPEEEGKEEGGGTGAVVEGGGAIEEGREERTEVVRGGERVEDYGDDETAGRSGSKKSGGSPSQSSRLGDARRAQLLDRTKALNQTSDDVRTGYVLHTAAIMC